MVLTRRSSNNGINEKKLYETIVSYKLCLCGVISVCVVL